MVGIVIVCHSRRLAEGVKELAGQMGQGRVPIEVAAGMDDPDTSLGTDFTKVAAAIETVNASAPGGVLVLVDLGSAVLSAEASLDLLPRALKGKVRLCGAPLVEGAVAAVARAATGASLDVVAAEALGSLAAKAAHLEPKPSLDLVREAQPATTDPGKDVSEKRLKVANAMGLHARPAANLVRAASRFRSTILVHKGPKAAAAESINQLMTLGVRQGDEIRVTAVGEDAESALAAIEALAAEGFGDQTVPGGGARPLLVSSPAALKTGTLAGLAASPGVAVGPAHLHRPGPPKVSRQKAEDPSAESARLAVALKKARAEIASLAAQTRRGPATGDAAIFDVHRLILEDRFVVEEAERLIRETRARAEWAWLQVMESTAQAYRSVDDAYIQARAADVLDAGARVIRRLTGERSPCLGLKEPGVIVAHDLLPSDLAGLDREKVLGVVTAGGGENSHAAILARSLEIPAVVGAGTQIMEIDPGTLIGLDGDTGRIWISPDENTCKELEHRCARWQARKGKSAQEDLGPAVTADGFTVRVTANIHASSEAARAFERGADGVGLFRTEFLYQAAQSLPAEEEQAAAYAAAARAMRGRPVTIRTLDAGGDKPIAAIPEPGEDNPALGARGIRLCLAHSEVFRTQLRALVRAALEGSVRILLPMVSHLGELRAARELIEQCRLELAGEGWACQVPLEVGIMVEVPAAVAMADRLAQEADFFSIGTNDLTQYMMAADRGNTTVAHLSDSFHPAVLRMVRAAVEAGHGAGIPVGICGELAGKVEAVALLVGLGLDELSLDPHLVPEIKAAIRKLSREKCRQIAARALDQEDGAAVRRLLADAARHVLAGR